MTVVDGKICVETDIEGNVLVVRFDGVRLPFWQRVLGLTAAREERFAGRPTSRVISVEVEQ